MNPDSPPASPTRPASARGPGHDLRSRRLHLLYSNHPTPGWSTPASATASDADKYRWIRANRGHLAIAQALSDAAHDADFDTRIEAAMRAHAEGPAERGRCADDAP